METCKRKEGSHREGGGGKKAWVACIGAGPLWSRDCTFFLERTRPIFYFKKFASYILQRHPLLKEKLHTRPCKKIFGRSARRRPEKMSCSRPPSHEAATKFELAPREARRRDQHANKSLNVQVEKNGRRPSLRR